jgi:hypothetical protein
MSPSELIDSQINKAEGWKKTVMQELRNLLNSPEYGLEEDWKWSVGVWTKNGKPVCAFSAFKDYVKLNFFNGVQLQDEQKLFNSGLESKKHRSINCFETDTLNKKAIKDLINAAILFS